MTADIVASAPGKLFLLGEYAVLDGCPAVVAAVDRRVEVRVRIVAASRVRIVAPGFADPLEFPSGAPPATHAAHGFTLAAYRAVGARLPRLAGLGMDIEIVSRLAQPDGTKTGLGSSAAVTVAVVAALFAAVEGDGADARRAAVFGAAFAAHRAAQGGLGSGADVAAAVYGGVLRCQPRVEGLPGATPLGLPTGTALLAAWSGETAATPGLVQRYLGMRNGARAVRATFVDASRRCVERFVDGLNRGALLLTELDTNGAALEQLGTALDVPLVTARLRELIAIARAHGAGAKISGAGGGDCGIALTTNPTAATRIRAQWRTAGLVPLDLQISAEGVTVGRR